MRIGFHTFSFNMSEESPIRPLIDCLRHRGHEVLFLDTEQAHRQGDHIVFPEFRAGDPLDMFISYLPSCNLQELHHGKTAEDVAYFDQVRWLSDHYQTPTPYSAQLITNSKTLMAQAFQQADVPIPASYDGTDLKSRDKILRQVHENATAFVFKPDFGGNSRGIIKTHDLQETEKAFRHFSASGKPFLVQEYVDISQAGGQSVDYRAFVVADRVVAGIKCTTPGEWKRDYDQGTTEEPHQFTPDQQADAVCAIQAVPGFDFGSVDILIDPKTERHYICEINDNLPISDYEGVLSSKDLAADIAQMFEEKYGSAATSTPAPTAKTSPLVSASRHPSAPKGKKI